MQQPVPMRDIIVIGGSAGATAPLKTVLAALPASSQASIFVVLHIPTRSSGILSVVTAAAAKLPVVQAEDGMPYLPGHIYLGVPGRHLLLVNGHLRLGGGPRENLARPAIDALFRSAAFAHGPRVVGVLLSGLLNDGSAGLAAIKRCGGLALVQDPADAIADEMPRSAMRATAVDAAVPAAELGDLLSTMASRPAGVGLPAPPDLQLEVEIAAGERLDTPTLLRIAQPSALTCPSCGGVMSVMHEAPPLRFRCQVGHAMTAEVLAREQEDAVDEAMRVALRVIEERATLVERMAREAASSGRPHIAETYEDRSREYRHFADVLRTAVMATLAVDTCPLPPADTDAPAKK